MSHRLKVPYDNLQQKYVIKGLRTDNGQAHEIVCTGKHEKANAIWSTAGSGCWEFKVDRYRLFGRYIYRQIDCQVGRLIVRFLDRYVEKYVIDVKANAIWSTGGSGCWEFKVDRNRLFKRLLLDRQIEVCCIDKVFLRLLDRTNRD